MDALATGRGLPTILNAANEIAVEAFLAGKISFGQIIGVVRKTCEAALADATAHVPADVADALAVDHVARERAAALLD